VKALATVTAAATDERGTLMSTATQRPATAGLLGRLSRWSRPGRRVAAVGVLAAMVTVVLPAAPAAAVQTIVWTTQPPTQAVAGSTISVAVSGTANTFLGARITGCFVNFPDGNYANSFGGNFTTGNCSYTNRPLPSPGNYPVTIGFTLSNGSTMSLNWNVAVVAPTPTVYTSGSITATAEAVAGTPVFFNAYGYDAYYGYYGANCSPPSGTALPVGTTTVTCSATNSGGRTGYSSFPVTIVKATPTVNWSPPGQLTYGQPLGSIMSATVDRGDATGSINYVDEAGQVLDASTLLPPGPGHTITARYTPSGAAAAAYSSASVVRTVDVVDLTQSVAFDSSTPVAVSAYHPPFAVSAIGTVGGEPVTITALPGSVCTVEQASGGTAPIAFVTVTRGGQCVLAANQPAGYGHAAAPQATHSVNVAKANSTLAWAPPREITYGTPLAGLLTASPSVPGALAYRLNGQPVDAGTVPDAGDGQILDVTFTPDESTQYTGATASRTVSVAQAPQSLTVAPVADHVFGDEPFDLTIGGDGPGAVTTTATGACTIDGAEVTLTAAGECTVTVGKAGTSNYLPADPSTQTFTTAPGTVALQWDDPAAITYGTALGDDQLDAVAVGAGGPTGQIEYTFDDGTPALGVVPSSGDHTLHATWTAVGASADNWHSATRTVTLHVSPAAFSPAVDATITGTPQVGLPLVAGAGGVAPAPDTLTYRWFADGAAIEGANGSTFIPAAAQLGKAISVEVTAGKADHVASTNESAPTAAVAPGIFTTGPSASITGTVKVGAPLTAGVGSPVPAPDGYTYRWSANGTPIADATHATYTPTAAQKNATLSVTVTAVLAGYAPARSTATASGPVATDLAPALQLRVDDATLRRGESAHLTWTSLDAESITASGGWTGARVSSGTMAVSPTKLGDTTYVLRATNSNGTTTAQVAVRVTRPATVLQVTATDGARAAGTRIGVTAGGLDAAEAYTVRIAGVRVAAGKASETGRVARSVVIPTGLREGSAKVTVTGSLADRTGMDVVRVIRPAKVLRVAATNGLRLAGTRIRVTAGGLAAGEAYTVRIAGARVAAGKASDAGRVSRSVVIPTGLREGSVKVTVTGSVADRKGADVVRVVTRKRLAITVASSSVRASDSQRYTVRGLAAGERLVATYKGKQISPAGARADAHGVYTGTFDVRTAWGTKTVKVTGQFASRTGSATFQVVRRCVVGHVCA
jgi:hypothetical protein